MPMERFNEAGASAAPRPRPWQALTAVAVSMTLLSALGPLLLRWPGLRYSGLALTEVVCIAAPALLLAGLARLPPRPLFRLRAPSVRLAAPVAMVAASGFVLSQSLAAWMERWLGPGYAPDWEVYAPRDGPERVAALLALAVAPAVCEELMFRGYVLRGIENLRRRGGGVPSAMRGTMESSLIVGFLFAVGHLSPTAFPSQLLLGALITFVVLRADSILAGMAMHAACNGAAVLLWHTVWMERLPDAAVLNLSAVAVLGGGLAWVWRASRGPADAGDR